MKTFTFFYNRYETATSSLALAANGINHHVMIHNQNDYDKFVKGKTVAGVPVVTNNGKGLAYQRNSALDLMDTGKWAVFMCDDFEKIKSLPFNWIRSNRKTLPIDFTNQNSFRINNYATPTLREMYTLFPMLIDIAEKNGICLIGFGLHDNPMNLKNKFSRRGLADGRFWLVKKNNRRFDEKAQLIDDMAWTAENLLRHNNVLILNWLVPYFERYTAGGFGTTAERMDLRKKECAYLVRKYSPLIRFAKKPNWPDGSHIRIAATDKNIAATRSRFGL